VPLAAKKATAKAAETEPAAAAAEDHVTNKETAGQAVAGPRSGVKELCSGVSWVPAVVPRLVLGGLATSQLSAHYASTPNGSTVLVG